MRYRTFLLLVVLLLLCLASCNDETGNTVEAEELSISFYQGEHLYCLTTSKRGENIPEPTTPLQEGYEFVGWYKDGVKWDFSANKAETDVVLEARWRVDFRAMFPLYFEKGIEFAQNGEYLILDTNPQNQSGYCNDDILYKIRESVAMLGLPEELYFKMNSTTAASGAQTFDGKWVAVEWTNSPNEGLRVIYTRKNEV